VKVGYKPFLREGYSEERKRASVRKQKRVSRREKV